MIHYEYCSPRQFDRLSSDETVTLGYRDNTDYQVGDTVLLSIYPPPKDQIHKRMVEVRITAISSDGLSEGYIALTLENIGTNQEEQ